MSSEMNKMGRKISREDWLITMHVLFIYTHTHTHNKIRQYEKRETIWKIYDYKYIINGHLNQQPWGERKGEKKKKQTINIINFKKNQKYK